MTIKIGKKLIEDNLKVLDTFRGLAAIYVLIGHSRWLLWEGYNYGYKLHPERYNLIDKALMYFFALFQFGHQSVLFFFVLSGFVIHWSSNARFNKTKTFHIGDYLYRRFKRIYPPLLIAIVVTLVLDYVGLSQKLPVYFSQTPYPSINENIHPILNWSTLLGNLAFLQTVYTPVWGSNGPLWSLMYEWWFYILYVPIFWCYRKNKLITAVLVLLIWVLNAKFAFGPLLFVKVTGYFIAWFIGMLLADVLMSPEVNANYFVAYLLLILIINVFLHSIMGWDIALAILITALLYWLLTNNLSPYFKQFRFLGDFSYTLYITHVPLICILSGCVMYYHRGLPVHSYYIFAGIFLSLVMAWGLHLIGEKPFIRKK
jgi:peptidoglycan/LPS O-acetylase OafA/YrhL